MAAWWETTFAAPQEETPWWESTFKPDLPDSVFGRQPVGQMNVDIPREEINQPWAPEPSPYTKPLPAGVDTSQLDQSSQFGNVPSYYLPESLAGVDVERSAEQFAKPPRAGLMETAGMIGGAIYDAAAYHAPASIASALEGSDPFAESDWKDKLIERSRARAEERRPYFGNRPTALGFADESDLASLGPSLGFSGAGMAAGLAAGVGTSAALAPVMGPSALVPGYLSGGAASFGAAYQMSTNAFVRDLRESIDQERAAARMPPISDEEFSTKQEELAPLINEYGLWEAVPEAASNVLGFGIIKAPVKAAIGRMFGKNIATRLATKTASVYGVELGTETVTGMGQHNIGVKTGLMDGPLRDWSSTADLGETFKEIAPTTILQTTLLAGGTALGVKLQERVQRGDLTKDQYELMMEFNNQVERGQIDPEAAREAALKSLDPLANRSNQMRYREAPSGGTLPAFDEAFNAAAADIDDDTEVLLEQNYSQMWEREADQATDLSPLGVVSRETSDPFNAFSDNAMAPGLAGAPLMGGLAPIQAPKAAAAKPSGRSWDGVDVNRLSDEEFDQWYTDMETEGLRSVIERRKRSGVGAEWRTAFDPTKDGLLELLAKRGGLDSDAFEAEGFDVKGMKERRSSFNNNRIPGKPVFRGKGKGGLRPDDVAELIQQLAESGSMVVPQDILDEYNRTTITDVLNVLAEEVNGTPVIFSGLKAQLDQEEATVRNALEEAARNRREFREIESIFGQDANRLADLEPVSTHDKEFYNPEWDAKTRTLADWMDDAIDEGVSDQEIESVLTDDMPIPERVRAINQLIEAKRDARFDERVKTAFQSRTAGPLPAEAQGGPQAQAAGSQELESAPNARFIGQTDERHSKSSTQVNLPEAEAARVRAFGKSIPDSEIYIDEDTKGREDEPHVTVLYGITNDNPTGPAKALRGVGPVTFRLGRTKIFEQDKYDVLVAEVKGESLRKANAKLTESVEYENDYPDYKPHVTIAYLKKGEGQKYVGRSDLEGVTVSSSDVLFTATTGDRYEVKTSGDLLGQDTTKQQALGDRARAQEEKRSGKPGVETVPVEAGAGELFAGERPKDLFDRPDTERAAGEQGEVTEDSALYSGYERDTDNLQTGEKRASYDKAVQLAFDLDAPADIPSARAQAIDNFNTFYKRTPVGEIRVGVKRVTNEEEAAHVFSSLRKNAAENFYALVLDKDGKILDVQSHSIGTRDSASVDPKMVGPAVVGVPGSAKVYFAHNHPTGLSSPSSADDRITRILENTLEGSGVEVVGHVVVGSGTEYSFIRGEYGPTSNELRVTPRLRNRTIPVTQSKIRKTPNKDRKAVSDPESARAVVDDTTADNAIILLDVKMRPIGSLALSPEEMAALKKTGTVRRILAAIDKTNAANAIVKGETMSAVDNVTKYLSTTSVINVLDGFVLGESKSLAESGNLKNNPGIWFDRQISEKPDSPKNLYVAHNLSAEKLIHASELGGLVAPSLATSNIDKGAFDSFGAITLLADPSIIESSRARTFDADAYSPRHPRVEYQLDDKAYEALAAKAKALPGGFEFVDDETLSRDGPDRLINNDAMKLLFLTERGLAPATKRMKVEPWVQRFAESGKSRYAIESDPEFIQTVTRKHRREIAKAKNVDPDIASRLESNSFETTGDGKKELKYWVIRNAASEVGRYMDSKGVDAFALRDSVSKKLRPKKFRAEYEAWVTDEFNKMVKGKQLFKGFTYSGRRRYVPYTVENILKEMTRQLQGGEGFNYGAGSVRAAYAKELKTVAQVQKLRDRIVSNGELKEVKEESQNRLIEALDALRPYYKYDTTSFGYMDDASNAIAEGPAGWREAFNMDEDSRKIITDLVEYLRTLPTEYFETKMQRLVGLEEFKYAVVPRGTRKDVVDILKNKGLTVRFYKNGDNADRARAIRAASDVLFERDGMGWFENQFSAKPSTADSKSTALTRQLEAAISRFTGEKVKPGTFTQTAVPKSMRSSIRAIERAFGKRVVFYKVNGRIPFSFNGVALPTDPKTIYVNIDSQNPFMGVAGHELLHTLRMQHPELYDRLAALARAHIKTTGYAEFARKLDKQISENQADKRLDDDKMFEEMVANIVGDAMMDPAFINELAAQDRTFLERLVAAIMDILNSFTAKMQSRGMGSSQYFNNIEGLKGRVQAILKEQARSGRSTQQGRIGAASPAFQQKPANDTFYSALTETIDKAEGMPKKGDPAMFKQWLDGQQRKGGFKQEERDWMGLDEWLDGQQEVTREALQEFVRQNQVTVEETVLGGPDVGDINMLPEGYGIQERDGRFYIADAEGLRDTDYYDTPEEAIDEFIYGMDSLGQDTQPQQTKYGGYQLPGGENYRELLLRVPVASGEHAKAIKREREANQALVDFNEQNKTNPLPPDEWKRQHDILVAAYVKAADDTKRREALETTFRSSHFDEPNILAHVRFNERHTSADGTSYTPPIKVLFIEEIQSDWHQKGRKEGYGSKQYRVEYRNADGYMVTDATYDGRGTAERNAVELDDGRVIEEAAPGSIPDAPFKKSWPLLAMKRMIRYAAENGFDSVAWTTGEQQAERYDLSKQVISIEWSGRGNDTEKSVSINPRQGNVLEFIVRPDGIVGGRSPGGSGLEFDGKHITDVIGKDLGERLLSETYGDVIGDDLKIGGEGMKGFYDKILPAEVNKYVKKWGGKVGKTSIGKLYRGYPQMVHSLDITESMRQSALEGQPMFQSVYHGSPHKWDLVDLSKVGTGEGAQAFGWGFYAAEVKDIAQSYTGPKRVELDGPEPKHYSAEETALQVLRNHSGDFARARKLLAAGEGGPHQARLLDALEKLKGRVRVVGGNLYEIDLPDSVIEKMLDWDAPMSKQPETVRAALKNLVPPKKLVEDLSRNELIGMLQKIDPNGTYSDEGMTLEFGEPATLEELQESAESLGLQDYLDERPGGWSEGETGRSVYYWLTTQFGGTKGGDAYMNDAQKLASEKLNELGIPGIKYLDGTSRNGTKQYMVKVTHHPDDGGYVEYIDYPSEKEARAAVKKINQQHEDYGWGGAPAEYIERDGTRNFVVFDAKHLKTLTRNGEPVTLDDIKAEQDPKFSRTDQTQTPEFKEWFDNSQVLDKNGNPLVLYHHGTFGEGDNFTPDGPMHFGTEMAAMQRSMGKEKDRQAMAVETYQDDGELWHWEVDGTTSEDLGLEGYDEQETALVMGRAKALEWVEENPDFDPENYGNLTPVYLSIQNPKRVIDVGGANGEWDTAIKQAKAEGYDGIVYRNKVEDKGSDSYIAFRPNQVKSATGNIGAFSRDSDDIRFARSQGTPSWVPRVKPLSEVLKSRWDYWMRAQGNLPDVVFAEKIKRDNSMGADELHIRHKMADFDRAVRLAYGKSYDKLTNQQKEDLNDYLAGANVTIPAGVKRAMDPMRDYLDRLSNMMISRGVVQNQDTIDKVLNNLGKYLNRSYQAFDNPSWPREVPESVRRAAYQHIEGRMRQAGQLTGLTAQQIEDKVQGQINNILEEGTAADSLGALVSESKLGSKDLSMLIQRKEIPKPIRDLLGEYRDARVNFVRSATKMERAVMNHIFLEGVKANGMNVFLFNEPTGEHSVRIAADASSPMSPLNGLYTTPEIRKAFTDALDKEQMANWYRWILGINGFVKYGKTVLSVTTISRNFLSASFFGVANGHFALFNPKATKTAFQTIQRELRNAPGSRAYAEKMKRLGVIYDNPFAGEMMDVLKDFTDSQSAYMEGALKGGARKFFDIMTRIYQSGDDFWKILGFEIEAANLEKHGGMTRQAAEREAAERIRNTYPTYSMIGKAVKWVRRFPLIGTFVSFPAEIVRTSVNIVRYAVKDAKKPGMKVVAAQKMAGIALAAGLAATAREISMAIMGFDDDDDEAVRMMGPPWSKNSDMLYVGYDENGLPEYFDLSFLDPYNYLKRPLHAMLRGDDDWQDKLKSALTDMTQPFIGTDILAGALGEVVYNQKETGGPVYNPDDAELEQFKAIFNHLRKAVQPGTFGNIERMTKAVKDDTSRWGQQYKVADELWAVGGFRKSTLNPLQSIAFQSMDFASRTRNASQILSYPLGGQNEVSDEDIENAFGRMIDARRSAFQDMVDYVALAKSLGVSNSSIRSVLKASGVSADNVTALMRGRIPAWEPSSQFLDNAKERAIETAPSKARQTELRRTFDQRVRLVKKLAREEARRARTDQP